MAEKIQIEVSQKTAELLNKHKHADESMDQFLQRLVGMILDEESQRRILIIGPPAAGKSTIRRVFFEDGSPKDLLDSPLEPTRGIENYAYNWLDVTAGIVDSAGQEIERWLGLDSKLAFSESDSIIFVIDAVKFPEYQNQILEDLTSALEAKEKHAIKSQFNIFLHKIDLIPDEKREEHLNQIKRTINSYLEEHDRKKDMILMKYYYTSIKGELILTLVKAMRSVLYAYSKIMRRALIPYSMRM